MSCRVVVRKGKCRRLARPHRCCCGRCRCCCWPLVYCCWSKQMCVCFDTPPLANPAYHCPYTFIGSSSSWPEFHIHPLAAVCVIRVANYVYLIQIMLHNNSVVYYSLMMTIDDDDHCGVVGVSPLLIYLSCLFVTHEWMDGDRSPQARQEREEQEKEEEEETSRVPKVAKQKPRWIWWSQPAVVAFFFSCGLASYTYCRCTSTLWSVCCVTYLDCIV